ncbi:uncharacterized protein LOC113003043 isoform X1 [Solenopsis invicta]|uniref:uncharacterized protein LOC113003043 isoform X1 n=1 Tax=Solenopsis invicta TaxID=13686 RepID=UPI00193E2F86|nr:uncharacterized protein LOC113003043 isoform X1 [Solenopsis invicta]
MEYQLRSLLEDENIEHSLQKNARHFMRKLNANSDDSISDIQDGLMYLNNKYIKKKNDEHKIVLSLNMNTDGTPIFESSKKSIWPLQCIINELPPKIRFKTLILASLWVTTEEPKPKIMNIYLSIFLKQLERLMNRGIKITNILGETNTYYFILLCIPVDSVARPILQNRIQFNGYYGCSWCYSIGKYVGCDRYVMTEEDPIERSHKQYLKGINNSEIVGMSTKGVKGQSEMTRLPYFDCVWGFPVDYMHGTLLGIVKQLWDKWGNSRNYLKSSDKSIIDARLISINPPSEIHRLPRLLKDRAKWKATEWRSWLLYYSIPCLHAILPEVALNSYMLLVKSIHTLLSTNITEDNLMQCEIDLLQFVGDCQCIYGEDFMTFDVHTLLHYVESVRKNGPLWAISAFPFESDINNLKGRITGPSGVLEQIANRTLQLSKLKNYITAGVRDNKNSWLYCTNLFQYRRISAQNVIRSDEGAIIVNSAKAEKTKKYCRIIYRDTVFHSTSYTRPKHTNNTVVQLKDFTVVQISHFILIDNACYMIVKTFQTRPFTSDTVTMNHILNVESIDISTATISIKEIKTKLIYINIPNKNSTDNLLYVCIPPNVIEAQ